MAENAERPTVEGAEDATVKSLVVVPWFLWSIVYPGGAYHEKDIHAAPVHEYRSQAECQAALVAYQKEIDKAYPPQQTSGMQMVPWVKLICSPVNPKP